MSKYHHIRVGIPYPVKFTSSRLVCVKECRQYNGRGRNWRLLANQNDPKMGWVDRSTAKGKAQVRGVQF